MDYVFTGGAKTLLGQVRLAAIKFLVTFLICTCTISIGVERGIYMEKTSDVTTQSTVTKISVAADLTFP